MEDAVIVSTARSGLAKSGRGSFNITHGATMGGHVVSAAIERSGIDPAQVEDCIFGCGDRWQHRAPGSDPRGAACQCCGNHDQPVLFIRLAVDIAGGQRDPV